MSLNQLLPKSVYTLGNLLGIHRGHSHDDFHVKIKIAEPGLFATLMIFPYFAITTVNFVRFYSFWELIIILCPACIV